MKFNFTIESDNMEQDLVKLVDVFVNAYEKCSKIDNNVVDHVHNEIHSLDNRIDGIESRLSFCEVEKKETSKKDK